MRRQERLARQAYHLHEDKRADLSSAHSAADCVSVSMTDWRSNAERLITLRMSAVAVCCCSASESRSCLHVLEQPRVLDCDHGLVGERLQ